MLVAIGKMMVIAGGVETPADDLATAFNLDINQPADVRDVQADPTRNRLAGDALDHGRTHFAKMRISGRLKPEIQWAGETRSSMRYIYTGMDQTASTRLRLANASCERERYRESSIADVS